MFSTLFSEGIHTPLYNALVFLVSIVPFGDVGIAVIILTILVKLVLFPLGVKSARTQILMRTLEEPIKEIKQRYKDDPQEQARATMALYREKGLNPFSTILLLLIQLPIIFGLYWVFYKGGLPVISSELLYSFVPTPDTISMMFLGIVDMSGKSVVLAALAGITQFIQARYAMPPLPPRKEGEEPSFRDDMMRSMHLQMRYVFPVIVGIISYAISAAVALYWVTSNIVAIGQELYVRRYIKTDQK